MSQKVIVISGTPGTGKSTLAKKLAQGLGYSRLDLSKRYKEISVGYDKEKKCYDVDFKKFSSLVIKKLRKSEKGLIIDSHIAHLLPKRMVDLCIILTCSDLKRLERRLKKKGYSKKKIRENLDAEIFQVCLSEAKEEGHKVLVLDTSKEASKNKLLGIIEDKLKL